MTADERAAITELSHDLPAVWSAETTTNQERKQLLRMAIESVQLDGVSQAGQVEVQIRWRSGTIISLSVKRAEPGEGSLKTPEEAVSRIHEMARRSSYNKIAARVPLVGISPLSTWDTSADGMDWQEANRTKDQSRKTVRTRLVSGKLNKRCFVNQVYSGPTAVGR